MIQFLDDYFEYKYISLEFAESEVQKNIQALNQKFATLTNNWSEVLNSQWVARDYIASKMILSASVMLSSVEFANKKNLRIVEPYLIYYSLLNCTRAVILTSPNCEWNNGELFEMTHQKSINVIGDIIAHYNKEKGSRIKDYIDWAREYREIFSYKFPANGLTEHHLSLDETIDICSLLCEIAQLQSKALENSVTRNVATDYPLNAEILSVGYQYGGKNFQFIDNEDGYRLDYITRKQKRPYNLNLTMTEGMVEDFFGAWYPKDDSDIENVYNPDVNWRIIFPFN